MDERAPRAVRTASLLLVVLGALTILSSLLLLILASSTRDARAAGLAGVAALVLGAAALWSAPRVAHGNRTGRMVAGTISLLSIGLCGLQIVAGSPVPGVLGALAYGFIAYALLIAPTGRQWFGDPVG